MAATAMASAARREPVEHAAPLPGRAADEVERGQQRRGLTRADEFPGQVDHLGAVPGAPGSGVQGQQAARQIAVHDDATAMRRNPTCAMRADSVRRS